MRKLLVVVPLLGLMGAQCGEAGNCSVSKDAATGVATITCPDGTSVNVAPGERGPAGATCTVTKDADAGVSTIVCGDGANASVGDGVNGKDGANCSVADDADAGVLRITCPDGSSAEMTKPPPQPDCPPGRGGADCSVRQWPEWPMPNAPDAGLPNPAAYTVTADTVVDQVTGLEWQKGAVGRTANYYDMYWGDAQLYCDQLVLGGYSDWRLPSRIELVSLALESLEPGVSAGTDMLGDYVLPAARGSWSSSRLAWSQDYWYPYVAGAYTSFGLVIYPGEARCVRSASTRQLAAQRFSANTDTVLDNWTGLTWMRPFDATKRGTWSSAVAGCAALTSQGGGWRLPTLKELQTLVDETRVGPAIDTGTFPGTAAVSFWSSGSYVNAGNGQAYYGFVDFNLGQALHSEPNSERYYRCVK